MRKISNLPDIKHPKSRVPDHLTVDQLCVIVDQRFDFFRGDVIDKMCGDSQLCKVLKEVDGASVKAASRDNLISRAEHIQQSEGNRGHAG